MVITRLKVSNFKSFKDIDVNLDDLNILIGGNASGKSNFIQIFSFLRDICVYDLRNAISIQGGDYIRNIKNKKSNVLSIEIHSNNGYNYPLDKNKVLSHLKVYETKYKFEIEFTKEDKIGFRILNDVLTYKFNFYSLENKNQKWSEGEKKGEGEVILLNNEGTINFQLKKQPNKYSLVKNELIPKFILKALSEGIKSSNIMLETAFSIFPFRVLNDLFTRISIYDLDPRLAKRSISISGKADLEEDGSNIAIVLQKLLEDKDEKERLFNLIKNILPFVHDLGVESFVDTSVIMKLKETYSKRNFLPASLISDGTITITALIVALYFTSGYLNIFEEPERNIHPSLISKVLDMMTETSKNKQIIVTTHNPEFVKNTNLKNLLFISRDRNGYSTISRLDKKKEIKIFLENQIGIEELYIDNLLGEAQ